MTAWELLDDPPFTLVGLIPNACLEVWRLGLGADLHLYSAIECALLDYLSELLGSDLRVVHGEAPVLALVARFSET